MSTTAKNTTSVHLAKMMSSGRHGRSGKKIAEPSLQHHRVAATGGFGHPTSFAWNGIDGRAKDGAQPRDPAA